MIGLDQEIKRNQKNWIFCEEISHDADMPNRSRKPRKRADLVGLAKRIVDEATGQAESTLPPCEGASGRGSSGAFAGIGNAAIVETDHFFSGLANVFSSNFSTILNSMTSSSLVICLS